MWNGSVKLMVERMRFMQGRKVTPLRSFRVIGNAPSVTVVDEYL